METWSVLVWNLALGSRPKRDANANWAQLKHLMAEQGAQVALLNETKVPLGTRAIHEPEGTRGRDGKPRPWSTAVLSEWKVDPITDARPINYRGQPRMLLPFENSRPGSWTAAMVHIPDGQPVTCIALYGLLDDLSDASVHRSLSEVSPVFSDKRYNDRVILGGDLNLTTQWPNRDRLLDRARGVLERIEAYGLIDCLKLKRPDGRLSGCTCTLDPCTHTRTKWDSQRDDGGYPHQMDYLFASRRLVEADGLVRCEALDPERWNAYSDHAPIVAEFRAA
jgi:endonuclease/exonuclease/phosphatase family metal-dependent hydrolase